MWLPKSHMIGRPDPSRFWKRLWGYRESSRQGRYGLVRWGNSQMIRYPTFSHYPSHESQAMKVHIHWKEFLDIVWLVVWLPFFIFPYIGNNHPNWLIFFRGVQTTNQLYFDFVWFRLFPCLNPDPQSSSVDGSGSAPRKPQARLLLIFVSYQPAIKQHQSLQKWLWQIESNWQLLDLSWYFTNSSHHLVINMRRSAGLKGQRITMPKLVVSPEVMVGSMIVAVNDVFGDVGLMQQQLISKDQAGKILRISFSILIQNHQEHEKKW